MTKFTVRVELHDAENSDYERLHEEMERRGFARKIIGNDQRIFQLPPGEYNLIGDFRPQEVRDLAWGALPCVGKTGRILVTPSRGRWWIGLDEVENTDEEN